MALLVPKRCYHHTVRTLIVAYVTSVWKSNKQPKLVTTSVPLSHVVAFRAVEMSPMDHNVATWEVREHAVPWVVKPETLLAVLAPADFEGSVNLQTHSMTVQLSGESVAILDGLQQAPEWWPSMPEEGSEECKSTAQSGLFLSARRKRKPTPSGTKNHAAKKPVVAEKKKRGKKTDKKEKKDKKVRQNLLKNAKKEKQIACDPKNFRRNGGGPLLVAQTMVKLRCIEDEMFSENGATCFDADGKCMVQHVNCEGIMWEDVVNHAHPYLCAE